MFLHQATPIILSPWLDMVSKTEERDRSRVFCSLEYEYDEEDCIGSSSDNANISGAAAVLWLRFRSAILRDGWTGGIPPSGVLSSVWVSGVMSKRLNLRRRRLWFVRRRKYFWAWLATWVGVRVFTKFLDIPLQSPLPTLCSPVRNNLCSSSVHGVPEIKIQESRTKNQESRNIDEIEREMFWMKGTSLALAVSDGGVDDIVWRVATVVHRVWVVSGVIELR